MFFAPALLLALVSASGTPTLLENGYSAMYNLDFRAAHSDFEQWGHTHPGDPMGPISDAAAHLFSEFARLHILESQFFTDDARFERRKHGLRPDPAAKQAFERDLNEGQQLARAVLAHSPDDENALFSSVLGQGLHADYLALIEGRDFAALSEMKQGRVAAEHLIAVHPHCYDANLAVGVENYMLSLKAAPVRWMLRLGGAQTDKQSGIAQLRRTADNGHYLLPYARLLLAIADLRDGNRAGARDLLSWLATNFPGNPLYRVELEKLK
jgi:hypothetical protein